MEMMRQIWETRGAIELLLVAPGQVMVMVEKLEWSVAKTLHLHPGDGLVGWLQHCCLQDQPWSKSDLKIVAIIFTQKMGKFLRLHLQCVTSSVEL